MVTLNLRGVKIASEKRQAGPLSASAHRSVPCHSHFRGPFRPGFFLILMTANSNPGLIRRTVERVVDIDHWRDGYGQCFCPLDHPARVYIDKKFPYLSCLHQRCKAEVREVNRDLERETKREFGEHGIKIIQSRKEKIEIEKAKREAIKLRCMTAQIQARILPGLLAQQPITLDDWRDASPFNVRAIPIKEQWRYLLAGLYCPADLLWLGKLCQTESANFRPVREWLAVKFHPGDQMCPATFARSDLGRTVKGAKLRPYLILESDTVPLEQFGNVAMYAVEIEGLTLRAAVFTGGKSCHFWFDTPFWTIAEPIDVSFCKIYNPWQQHELREELEARLEGLGCDPDMWRMHSTTRLPGCERTKEGDWTDEGTGKWQELIYLNPKYQIL
jgi:hypothetical protein